MKILLEVENEHAFWFWKRFLFLSKLKPLVSSTKCPAKLLTFIVGNYVHTLKSKEHNDSRVWIEKNGLHFEPAIFHLFLPIFCFYCSCQLIPIISIFLSADTDKIPIKLFYIGRCRYRYDIMIFFYTIISMLKVDFNLFSKIRRVKIKVAIKVEYYFEGTVRPRLTRFLGPEKKPC